jgi:hypothetical protein
MADLDNDKVNDLEVAVIGSGSMGAVSSSRCPERASWLMGRA